MATVGSYSATKNRLKSLGGAVFLLPFLPLFTRDRLCTLHVHLVQDADYV